MTILVALDTLLPEVMRLAPSCPEPTALRQLRVAARTLCERLPVWREVVTETVTAPEDHTLAALPSGSELHRIETARLGDAKLEPIALADLDMLRPGWETEEASGNPRYLTQLGEGRVTIYPGASGALRLRAILKPTLVATTIPAAVASGYREVIGRGAAGNILTLPDAEFANPSLGASHLAYFNRRTNSGAQAKVRSGQQGARPRTKTGWF